MSKRVARITVVIDVELYEDESPELLALITTSISEELNALGFIEQACIEAARFTEK